MTALPFEHPRWQLVLDEVPIVSGPLVCAWCEHAFDQVALPQERLIGGDYQQKWFLRVRGDVLIAQWSCLLCGDVWGIGVGEHKGQVLFSRVRRRREVGDPAPLPGEDE